MTEKECREQPKPDWWNPENWKNPDGTEITAMEMEAWTHPKNPECERYYTDLLIKAQNDGKKFWCREVQVKALVATIDWFSGLTSKLIRGDEGVENQTGTSSPSDGAVCSESLVIDMNRMVYSVDVGTMCPNKAETYLRDLQNKYWN